MRILTGLVFIVNISLWVIGIVFGFSAEGGVVGYPGIIGFQQRNLQVRPDKHNH